MLARVCPSHTSLLGTSVSAIHQVRRKRLAFGLLGLLGTALTGCAIDERTFGDGGSPAASESVAPNEPGAMVGSAGNPGGEGPGRAPTLLEGVDPNAAASDAGSLNVDCSVGASECTSATEQRECDIDGHWASPVACVPACIGDRCGGECLPSTTECVSAVQFRACSSEGVWSAPQECEAACVGNACAGECKPNDTRCVSATEVQTCTDQGVWGASTLCTNACVDRACTGECVPTSTRCPSATQLQACNALGQWQAPEPCPLACVGDACGGECAPNDRRCNPGSGVPQLCSTGGAWQDQTACAFLCVGSGSCGGECAPNDRRCNPSTGIPQLCSPGGAWQNQAACQFVCQSGFCGGDCRPNARRCDPVSGAPQLCSATGQWQSQAGCSGGRACSSGQCVCASGVTDCNGTCVDLSTSAENCGSCNHSCGGGPCSAGSCEPFVLVSSEQFAHDLVVSGDFLYYGSLRPTRENIKRVPKNGGAGQTLVESPTTGNANTFGSLAVNGNQVYWVAHSNPGTTISQSTIVRANLDGSSATAFFAPNPPASFVGPIFASEGFLYWSATTSTGTSLLRASLAAPGAAPTPITRADSGALASSTVVGSCFFYNTSASASVLMRACSNGTNGPVHTSSTTLTIDRGAADASFLYFFEGSNMDRRVQKQPFTGNPAPIGGPSPRGSRIAVDNDFVYYFEQTTSIGAPACTDGYTLFRIPKTGASTPTALVLPPENCPTDLIADGEAQYWVNSETGTISKLAK